MVPKHERLCRIATELAARLPSDYNETLEVLGCLRKLAEWRHHGSVIPLPLRPRLTAVDR
jgi:hypothetical protein